MIIKWFSFTLFFILFSQSNLSHSKSSVLEKLLKKNERVTALSNYKDSEEVIKLKLKNLKEINKSRKKYRLKSVKLDILACRVANMHCVEMLKYNYMGHWNKAGYKPYHRYAFAGGRDHVGENLAAKWTTGSFDTDDESVLQMMLDGHKAFMAEVAPNDGHKQMVLVPKHTHVGIGYAVNNKGFRYAQEFLDRFVKIKPLPKRISSGTTISLKGKIRKSKKKYGPYALIIYYEPKPSSSFNYKRQPHSYFDGSNTTFLMLSPWKLRYNKKKRSFKIDIPFKNAKKGFYYIMLYVRDNVDTIPYVIKGSVSMDTRTAVPVTSLVIEIK